MSVHLCACGGQNRPSDTLGLEILFLIYYVDAGIEPMSFEREVGTLFDRMVSTAPAHSILEGGLR